MPTFCESSRSAEKSTCPSQYHSLNFLVSSRSKLKNVVIEMILPKNAKVQNIQTMGIRTILPDIHYYLSSKVLAGYMLAAQKPSQKTCFRLESTLTEMQLKFHLLAI